LWLGSDSAIKMMTRARERLEQYCAEDRAVLEDALNEALKNPQRLADYIVSFHRLRTRQEFVSVHTFRFRNAHFVIVATNSAFFLYDMWLDTELLKAAE
jgi:hypothetical protein